LLHRGCGWRFCGVFALTFVEGVVERIARWSSPPSGWFLKDEQVVVDNLFFCSCDIRCGNYCDDAVVTTARGAVVTASPLLLMRNSAVMVAVVKKLFLVIF